MSVEQAVTTDPRVLPRERCVTRYLLDDLAKTQPEKEFAVFEDGEAWSYEAVRRKVRTLAAGFAVHGVQQGDHVAVWMFDSKEAILTFFAINYLGAVFVPLNTAYKGQVLSHVLDVSDATVMVAHGQLLERLDAIETAQIAKVIHLGDNTAATDYEFVDFSAVTSDASDPPTYTSLLSRGIRSRSSLPLGQRARPRVYCRLTSTSLLTPGQKRGIL